jgi:hypothetical protein
VIDFTSWERGDKGKGRESRVKEVKQRRKVKRKGNGKERKLGASSFDFLLLC